MKQGGRLTLLVFLLGSIQEGFNVQIGRTIVRMGNKDYLQFVGYHAGRPHIFHWRNVRRFLAGNDPFHLRGYYRWFSRSRTGDSFKVGDFPNHEIRAEWLRANESCLEIPDLQHTFYVTSNDVFVRNDSNGDKSNKKGCSNFCKNTVKFNLINLPDCI